MAVTPEVRCSRAVPSHNHSPHISFHVSAAKQIHCVCSLCTAVYPEATPILRAAVPPRRLLSNISTTRQASTQVPRVPPQAQRVGEWGKDPHDIQLGHRRGGKGAYCELRSP